jgi:hypothetical protein
MLQRCSFHILPIVDVFAQFLITMPLWYALRVPRYLTVDINQVLKLLLAATL